MPIAVQLHRAADRCFGSLGKNRATRLVLSLFFKSALGIQRIFHFETLDDLGFAILTGGRKVLSRSTLGALLRAAPTKCVLNFLRRTKPALHRDENLTISIDEHAIPRFTRKFSIRKGFHTIRNKHMKIEKLFYPFLIDGRKLLSLLVTRGNAGLAAISHKLLAGIHRQSRGRLVRVILDAGAAHNHQQLLALAAHPNQVTLVRAPRKKSYRERWAALPNEHWTRLEEPGPFKHAPTKIIHFAQTRTSLGTHSCLRGARQMEVRTIVVREQAGRGKERWHALWIFNDESTAAFELIKEFRTRQHHEQTYRILLHDAFVDTAPSGYNKASSDPKRPGFQRNAITLFAWCAALAANALDALTLRLPQRFRHAHPRTLRRWFLNINADLYQGKDTLIVALKPSRLRPLWEELVRQMNRRPVRIPWLENRRLILAFARSRPEASFDPRKESAGVWC